MKGGANIGKIVVRPKAVEIPNPLQSRRYPVMAFHPYPI
jgi:hypothetical protein